MQPMCSHGVEVRRVMTRIQVRAPYNERFVVKAHDLGGRWRKRLRVWSFPGSKYTEVLETCNTLYGSSFDYDGRVKGDMSIGSTYIGPG